MASVLCMHNKEFKDGRKPVFALASGGKCHDICTFVFQQLDNISQLTRREYISWDVV